MRQESAFGPPMDPHCVAALDSPDWGDRDHDDGLCHPKGWEGAADRAPAPAL